MLLTLECVRYYTEVSQLLSVIKEIPDKGSQIIDLAFLYPILGFNNDDGYHTSPILLRDISLDQYDGSHPYYDTYPSRGR